MVKYKNYMETLVEKKFDEISSSLDCCICEECRNDIIAYALNQLPTKYIVSHQGEMYSKLKTLGNQYQADILSATLHGAEIVKKNPYHITKTKDE